MGLLTLSTRGESPWGVDITFIILGRTDWRVIELKPMITPSVTTSKARVTCIVSTKTDVLRSRGEK